MKVYTIYEIPGVKVGCDANWPLRAHEQNVDPNHCVILQQETDLIQVSIDELWWQIEKDYPVDTIPYFKIVEKNRKRASSGGKTAYSQKKGIHNPDRIQEFAMAGGNITGHIHKENVTGIFAMSKEKKKDSQSRGGVESAKIHKENGTGIFGMSKEAKSEACANGGKKAKDKIWINNGIKNKTIYPDSLNEWIDKGYITGMIKRIPNAHNQ
jgi:hypothetical protein